MTERAPSDTRVRLLDAAAELIAAEPGGDFSLRHVCDMAGVKMPTLYHFFGSKQGLIDAVIDRGFELYLGAKAAMESSGDPLQDIRNGWDAHIAFGLVHPGFYALMYGQVRPGYTHPAQTRASDQLRALTQRAAAQDRLVVTAEDAANHVLVANIGVTLRQVILGRADPELSRLVREGVMAAITGTVPRPGMVPSSHDLMEFAASKPDLLGHHETQLFIEWTRRILTAAKSAP